MERDIMRVAIDIAPSSWDKTRTHWDKLGPFYEGNPDSKRGARHTHAWGANIGSFVYSFSLPSGPWISARLSARLSSEYAWFSAPPNHFSDVAVEINGAMHPARRVIPDNGTGRIYAWSLDPVHLQEGRNELGFVIKAGAPYRNGLCIYHRAVVPNERDYAILLEAERRTPINRRG
jgi:hypothetical protein